MITMQIQKYRPNFASPCLFHLFVSCYKSSLRSYVKMQAQEQTQIQKKIQKYKYTNTCFSMLPTQHFWSVRHLPLELLRLSNIALSSEKSQDSVAQEFSSKDSQFQSHRRYQVEDHKRCSGVYIKSQLETTNDRSEYASRHHLSGSYFGWRDIIKVGLLRLLFTETCSKKYKPKKF